MATTNKYITRDWFLNNLRNFKTTILDLEFVAKESGKGLSTNDFTDEEKQKLASLENYDATALTGRVSDLESAVTTFAGSDVDEDGVPIKSVRTIANEELAKQLIPEGAKESLDTLEEIAAWIQSHPDDASAIVANITKLAGASNVDSDGKVTKSVAEIAEGVFDAAVETSNIDFATEWTENK